jgi:hypothetical protein
MLLLDHVIVSADLMASVRMGRHQQLTYARLKAITTTNI